MAYYQPNDPYYHQNDNYHSYPQTGNTGVAPDLPPQTYTQPHQQHYNTYDDAQSMKSYQSGYGGSQAHLNPQYEMSQVTVHDNLPPVPSMPYAFQQDYPPQRPGMQRDMSTGYSMAREKLLRRRSMRQVELVNGNLVLDVQVPSHITPKGMNDVEEMCKMRYTAATCDPDEFMRSKYSLRPYLYGRHTELFIVMTMYNEDEVLFVKTMNA
jgi:chitin synthase